MSTLHFEDKRLYMATIREMYYGDIYLDLADRFDLSQEKRELLDKLLDEPDGDIFYLAEWEMRARALFDVWKEDNLLFHNALFGIAQYHRELRRQRKLN